jgi:2-keto-4-pentenoate hydratase/2-oxohepta-3-ene-1,7-dioic acid hydratase in catechol pathway
LEKWKGKAGIILKDGSRVDVSGFGSDFGEGFFATDGLQKLAEWLSTHGQALHESLNSDRLGPPVSRPSKIVCIGLNYRDHAAESKMEPPR